MPGKPSPQLAAAWEAEGAAMERGDVDARRRGRRARRGRGRARCATRVERMQRRAFELQLEAGPVEDASDPVDEDPEALTKLQMPVVAAAGELDMPDFITGAETLAKVIPGARFALIPSAGHLAPLEAPEAFRELVLTLH